MKMPFVYADLTPDPPELWTPSNQDMTKTLSELARLASLSTPRGWKPGGPETLSQRKAKLWYQWAEARIEDIPPMSGAGDLWTILRRKLHHWLVLKLEVLEYASHHLHVLAVDIADHIVRLSQSQSFQIVENCHVSSGRN